MPGTLAVITRTSGSDPDTNGYGVRVDGGDAEPVLPSGRMQLPGLPSGEHTVELVDIAPTCSLAAPNPRTVQIASALTTTVEFQILCSALPLLGSVQVAVTTAGASPDPDGYLALLDDGTARPLRPNDLIVLESVPAGLQSVRLGDVADNCTVGSNPDTVTVVAGETTEVAFQVTCWPPLTGRIAFSRNGDIYLQNADGTGLRQLTSGEGEDEFEFPILVDDQPDWSPDGRRIAFARDDAIFTTDAGGSEPVRLTPDTLQASQESPEWSPDGRRLLFIGDDRGEGGTLYMINADGSGLRQVPTEPIVSASWAPDGRRIAAVLALSLICCSPTERLFLLDADGSNPRDISTANSGFGTVEWSPDGERLAIVGFGGGLSVADTLGSPLQIVPGEGISSQVSWSPDGQRISFAASEDSGPVRIFTVNRDGSGLVQRTGALPPPFEETPGDDLDPAWGP